MSSEVNVVRLQAENIDLRTALQRSQDRIEKLVLAVTQASMHDPQVMTNFDNGDDDLIALIKKNAAANKRNAPAANKAGSVGRDSSDSAAAAGQDDTAALRAEIERLKQQLEASKKAAIDLDKRCGEYERERDALAEAIVDVKETHSRLTSEKEVLLGRCAESEQRYTTLTEEWESKEMEWGMRIEEAENQRDEFKAAAEVNPNTQEAIDNEVARRVEEEVFTATMDYEEKLDAIKAENEALRLTIAEHHKTEAERAAALKVSEAAVNERNIAVHVRDGAIADAKKLRIDLQAAQDRNAKLEKDLEALRQQQAAAGSARDDEMQALQRATREALAKAEAAERLAAAAQQRVKEIEDKAARFKAEFKATDDARAEAELRIMALQQQLGGLKRKTDSSEVLVKAMEEAQRAEKEALRKRHEEQMKRLQAKYKDTNDVVRATFSRAREQYLKLVERMRLAQSAEDKEDLFCDLIYEYEWNIGKLQEEVASMKTVGDIRETDATAEMQRRIDEAMSFVEILRMQIREAGQQPCC